MKDECFVVLEIDRMRTMERGWLARNFLHSSMSALRFASEEPVLATVAIASCNLRASCSAAVALGG